MIFSLCVVFVCLFTCFDRDSERNNVKLGYYRDRRGLGRFLENNKTWPNKLQKSEKVPERRNTNA